MLVFELLLSELGSEKLLLEPIKPSNIIIFGPAITSADVATD